MKFYKIISVIVISLLVYNCHIIKTTPKTVPQRADTVLMDIKFAIDSPKTIQSPPIKELIYSNNWLKIDSGLYYAEWDALYKSLRGDSKIITLKIDPLWYDFKLIMAKEIDKICRTGPDWSTKYNLTAAINASMFETDYLTSCGYMKNFNFINNEKIRKNYNSIISFNPIADSLPSIDILELDSALQNKCIDQYQTQIQNIRIINDKQENVWKPSNRSWSIACFGIDSTGCALFIFCNSPYSVHDFGNFLLTLPLKIKNVSYLDGGRPAFFYLNTKDFNRQITGYYENRSDSQENNNEISFYKIPNILSIIKKDHATIRDNN